MCAVVSDPPSTNASQRLEGEIRKVAFHAEDTGYCILQVRVRGHDCSVLGHLPQVQVGQRIVAQGEWVHNRHYGRQFQSESIIVVTPQSAAALRQYLSGGVIRGIGPKLAKVLVHAFGTDVLNVIANEPEKIAHLPGLGAKRAASIHASWQAQQSLTDIALFLQQHGIGTARAIRIHRAYGSQAIPLIEENPYRLCDDLHGVGFATADRVALSLGMARDAPQRIRYALRYHLQQAASQGHSAQKVAELIQVTSRAHELVLIHVQDSVLELFYLLPALQ